MMSRGTTRSPAAALLVSALVSCAEPAPVAPPPKAVAVQRAAPQVLDAFAAEDRAWVYVDGRALRQAVLPDLLRAVSGLRADVEVGLASAAAKCGFQPLLSIDEALLWIRWTDGKRAAWAAVLRTAEPFDRETACLRLLAPEASETALDGRRAWQLGDAFVVWDDGLFVVASSAFDAQSTLARLDRPEPSSLQARGALAGRLFVASVAEPDPFDLRALRVQWVPSPSGSRLDLSIDFTSETSARQAEQILGDGLRQMLGSNASFDPAARGASELVAQRSSVQHSGSTLAVAFDLPLLAGQPALVATLTSLAVRAVRLHTAWDLTAEARDTVFVIARALADYAARSRAPGHGARFPPSAPLVPDEIPYGKRVTPNPHAFSHPSWQDIHYSSDRPTYYAYDFVTAKDGRSVVVRARGDIDGDGTTSLFELDVRLDAHDAPVIAPMIRERDPEE